MLVSVENYDEGDVEDYYTVDFNTINSQYDRFPYNYIQKPRNFLPPESYKSHIKLGTDLENRPTGLNKHDLTRHVYIVGVVGSGKTTAVKKLLVEAALQGITWTVIDWEGEYQDLVYLTDAKYYNSKNLKIKPFGYGKEGDWVFFAEVQIRALKEEDYHLTPQMEYVFLKAAKSCQLKGQGLECLRNKIKEISSTLPDGKRTLQALCNRLEKIFSGLSHILSGEDTLGSLIGNRIVIDISDIAKRSPMLARVLVGIIMGKLRYEALQLSVTNNIRHLVVIEEAEQVIPSESEHSRWRLPYIASDLMRYRKRGVGIIIVAHSPTLTSKRVIKNVGNFMIFRLNDGEDKLWAARLFGLRSGIDASIIGYLDKGEALVYPASLPEPFLIRVTPPRPSKKAAIILLDSLKKYPGLPQRERRALLGLSGKQYEEAVKTLENLGLVRKVKVYTGRPGKNPIILELVNQNPSGAHTYVVNELKRSISQVCGRKVKYIYASSSGPDIIAVGDNILIGIEAETGTNISRAKYLRFLGNIKYLFIVCVFKKACRRAQRATLGLENVWVGSLYRFPAALARVCHREYYE